jgi:membrane glycosyltransferase
MAPIMLMTQSKAVAEILLGRDSGWQAQRRDGIALERAESFRNYAMHTALGLLLAASAYAVSLSLLLWMTPVLVGLSLAIPIAMLTSSSQIGERLSALGLLLIPEERRPPPVVVRANALAVETSSATTADPFARLSDDPDLLAAHRRMLPAVERRRRGDVDVPLVVALAKIDEAVDRQEAIGLLSPAEIRAVLASGEALDRLFAKPSAS